MDNKLKELSSQDIKGMLAVSYGGVGMAALGGAVVGLIAAVAIDKLSNKKLITSVTGAAVSATAAFLYLRPAIKSLEQELSERKWSGEVPVPTT